MTPTWGPLYVAWCDVHKRLAYFADGNHILLHKVFMGFTRAEAEHARKASMTHEKDTTHAHD